MKKRIRRKKRIKEFAEYGFVIKGEFTRDLLPGEGDILWDNLIDFVEHFNCYCVGASNNKDIEFLVYKAKSTSRKFHQSPTNEERDTLAHRVMKLPILKMIQVSPWLDTGIDDEFIPKQPRYLDIK